MVSGKQRRDLRDTVLEAIRYRRYVGGNENPALGKAILYVEELLLPWARGELADGSDDQPADVENLVADGGVKAIMEFHTFVGTTAGEFFKWVKSILAQLIAGVKRLREASRKGGLRHVSSLDRNAEAASLAKLLVAPDDSPEQIATLHENASRLHRAIRRLSTVERRVVKLLMAGHSQREIAVTFGHAPCWAQAHWNAAKRHLRAALLGA